MQTEFWERLRGYDKWMPTEATVKSSRLADVQVFSDNSPLFQLI
jgi:hypothetical protein